METMLMEADSTSEVSTRAPSGGASTQPQWLQADALAKQPANVEYFEKHIQPLLVPGREEQLMRWLQGEGLLAREMPCTSGRADCRMSLRENRRAVDGMSWECAGCGRRRPARARSVLAGLTCSIAHALQILLAWSEDRAHEAVATYLGVKEQDVLCVYERAEAAAAEAVRGTRLGGGRGVVLADMFPPRRPHTSPDSTDTHHHRILMLADTHHVPTRYYLHVMADVEADPTHKGSVCTESAEVSGVLARVCERDSTLVLGEGVPVVRARQLACVGSLESLLRSADPSLATFLRGRLWQQAVTLCAASREVCGAGAEAGAEAHVMCTRAVQRYLHVSLYRLQHEADGLYPRVLRLLAAQHRRRAAHNTTHTTLL